MAEINQAHQGSTDFEEYRRKMHPEKEEGRSVVPAPRKTVAIGFGIFMILIYVGVGVMFLFNVFKWEDTSLWTFCRWFIGILLILYGIFRAYRQINGSDYYSSK